MFFIQVLIALILVTNASIAYTQEDTPVGINLAGINDYNPAWVFVDLFKHTRNWIPQQVSGGPWDTGETLHTDENGWITHLDEGQAAATLVFGNEIGDMPQGEYVCLYDGEGEIVFGLAAKTQSSQPGRITFTVNPDGGSIYLKIIATNPENPIKNIRVIMPGFESTYEKQIFHPDFIDSLKGFDVIRFMDFQHTNGSPNQLWENRTTPETFSQATKRGVALEYMIELSNRAQCHPWFCMPHLATDNFIRNFAEMVKDNLDPQLKIYVEHSNEVWNGMFEQARYAKEQGKALGLSDNDYQAQLFYHSKRSVEIFKIWEEVFEGSQRLVRVLSSQSANPWTGEQVIGFQDAYQHADALGVAPYFGGSLGTPGNAAQTKEMSIEEILEACREDINRIVQTTSENVQNAQDHNLALIAYEAGQHLVGVGGWENDEVLTQKFIEANRHPRMKELYTTYMQKWSEVGGELMAIFSHIARPSKWGSWGILEYQHQDRDQAPKFQAVMDFIHQNTATGIKPVPEK